MSAPRQGVVSLDHLGVEYSEGLRECVRRSLILGGVVGTAKSAGSVPWSCSSRLSSLIFDFGKGTMTESVLLGLTLASFSISSSSSSVARPRTAPRSSSSHALHTALPNPGTTLRSQPAFAQCAKPGVLALMGVFASSIGLLMCAHRDREAKATFLRGFERGCQVGERDSEGRAALGLVLSFESEDLIRRKLGDGASVGTVGRSRGVGWRVV